MLYIGLVAAAVLLAGACGTPNRRNRPVPHPPLMHSAGAGWYMRHRKRNQVALSEGYGPALG